MKNPYVESLRPAWQNPRHVFVDGKRLKEVAKSLAAEFLKNGIKAPAWNELIFPKKPENFMKFILIANSINFCFSGPWVSHKAKAIKKYKIEYEGIVWSGAMAMAAALKRAWDQGRPLFNPDYLLNLELKDLEDIFRIDERISDIEIPFVKERLSCLREVGYVVKKIFDGNMLNLYKESGFCAFNNGRGLVELLIQYFSKFYDANEMIIDNFDIKVLRFHKRAQLLAMMYQGRALNTPNWPYPLLADDDTIGPPADYAVPVALEDVGILIYSDELKRKINDYEIILPGFIEEIEIRAQTVFTMMELIKEVNELLKPNGKKINIIHLDYKIWQMGRGIQKNHHLTPTIAY